MLSYQHIYHAGNHADILKHLTLSVILDSLNKKDKDYVVFDTHAGSGFYSLNDERAEKTGENKEGILNLLRNSAKIENDDAAFDAAFQYLKIQRLYANKEKYAGSPEIERLMMRENDQLILSELHPQAFEELKSNMKTEPLTGKKTLPQIHLHNRDGWETAKALSPVKKDGKTLRGLILMDPSFEDESDYEKCADAFEAVHKKWSTGIFALWYPILNKKKTLLADMKRRIKAFALSTSKSEVLDLQLIVKDESELKENNSLLGSGLFIVNPPYLLEEKVNSVLKILKMMYNI